MLFYYTFIRKTCTSSDAYPTVIEKFVSLFLLLEVLFLCIITLNTELNRLSMVDKTEIIRLAAALYFSVRYTIAKMRKDYEEPLIA